MNTMLHRFALLALIGMASSIGLSACVAGRVLAGAGDRTLGLVAEFAEFTGEATFTTINGTQQSVLHLPAACVRSWGLSARSVLTLTQPEETLGAPTLSAGIDAASAAVDDQTCDREIAQRQADGTLIIKSEIG